MKSSIIAKKKGGNLPPFFHSDSFSEVQGFRATASEVSIAAIGGRRRHDEHRRCGSKSGAVVDIGDTVGRNEIGLDEDVSTEGTRHSSQIQQVGQVHCPCGSRRDVSV